MRAEPGGPGANGSRRDADGPGGPAGPDGAGKAAGSGRSAGSDGSAQAGGANGSGGSGKPVGPGRAGGSAKAAGPGKASEKPGKVNGEAGKVNGEAGKSPGKPSAEPAGKAHAHAHGPTRRPPQVTRDTARPEGGGRAAPGRAPAPARQWPLLAVLGATGLGLLIVAFDAFRVGALIIGLALIGGAVLRWTLPSVGMLAVRSRFTDLFLYGGLGLAIVLLALMAQPHAWLKIPLLEDVLHFTVQ